jgi:hypothetical protein
VRRVAVNPQFTPVDCVEVPVRMWPTRQIRDKPPGILVDIATRRFR